MRTTLDIEDDVLMAVKELARRDGSTAGKVISEMARLGLSTPRRARKGRRAMRGGVPVLPSRGEIVSLEHVEQLKDKEGI